VLIPNRQSSTLEEKHFKVPKLSHHWNIKLIEWAMNKFVENVDWTSSKTKCLGLYENSSMFNKELYYSSKFSHDIFWHLWINRIIGLIPKLENLWIIINQILILFVNILALLSFKTSNNDYLQPEIVIGDLHINAPGSWAIIAIIGILILFFMVLLFIDSLVHSFPYMLKKKKD